MQERVERTTHVENGATLSEERVVSRAPSGAEEIESARAEYYDAAEMRLQTIARVIQGIYLVFGVIEALIGIRILLRLLGANVENAFAQFIYGITEPLIFPFIGIFPMPASGRYVLESHSLLALVIYVLLAYLLVSLVRVLTRPRDGHAWWSSSSRMHHHGVR